MTRIFEPAIEWDDQGHLRSAGFDDVYYNRKNGLEETRLVFLQGNGLPDNWLKKDNFVIAETGFGTGLNFLATWQMFEETAQSGERLDFISVEKFPLHKNDLDKALSPWRELVGSWRVDRLLDIYPPRIPGFHRRHVTDRVTLTIIFDDVLRAFSQLEASVDAWFLDGFAPKKNADMWQPALYAQMARLSHRDTTLGSFTAVGDVRRNLKEIGFTIKRVKGFAYKYHRTIGKFDAGQPKKVGQKPSNITIIGAGIAGATCAYALQRRGIAVTILEKEDTLGLGASGNQLGLVNPKIEAQDNPRNDAGLSAFSLANHILRDLRDIDYRQTGALHIGKDETKQHKLSKVLQSAGWLPPHMQAHSHLPLPPGEGRGEGISDLYRAKQPSSDTNASPSPGGRGIYYPDAATVNTHKLVKALLGNVEISFNHCINAIPNTPTILACGWGLRQFLPELPLQPVRGQVTYCTINDLTLEHPIMAGHYVAPMGGNKFSIGASFQQNNDNPEPNDSDDQENITALQKLLPQVTRVTCTGHWAGVRTASRDRFPIVGQIPDQPHVYVSGALGSHGIQFSLLHGEIIACLLTGAPLPIGRDALQSLSISRFYQD